MINNQSEESPKSTVKSNRPVVVGAFIFFGLLILAVTIFTMGGQKKTFVKTFTLQAIFTDVGGLLEGGNIVFSGVKVGTVQKVSLFGDSRVQVVMSIERNTEAHIHKGSKAKIGTDGLIGNKIVIIYGGDSTKPQVENLDFLNVERNASTDDMMATLQANNKNLLDITDNFKSISQKMNKGDGPLGALLNDTSMAHQIQSTLANLKETMANFKTTSENSKNIFANMDEFSKKLNNKACNSVEN